MICPFLSLSLFFLIKYGLQDLVHLSGSERLHSELRHLHKHAELNRSRCGIKANCMNVKLIWI
jgi:hypothetical protein